MRVRYGKTGRLRFVSAIDLGRIWERGLRKAQLPIAYSEGFSPHPKVSFTDALPLGYASTGEYAELIFAAPVEVAAAVDALNDSFPEGIAVLDARAVADGAPKLSRWLQASAWDLAFPAHADTLLAHATRALVQAERVPVERERKGESTIVDLRPAVHLVSSGGSVVRVVLHHVEPQVRPSEVVSALAHLSPHNLSAPTLVTRIAQGRPSEAGLEEAITGEVVAPLHH